MLVIENLTLDSQKRVQEGRDVEGWEFYAINHSMHLQLLV